MLLLTIKILFLFSSLVSFTSVVVRSVANKIILDSSILIMCISFTGFITLQWLI